MPDGRRINSGRPQLNGQVRVRDRSVYAFRAAQHTRSAVSMDGIVAAAPRKSPASIGQAAGATSPTRPLRSHHQPQTASKLALPRQSRSAVLARHAVAAKTKRVSAPSVRRRKKPVILIPLIALLLVGGTGISHLSQHANKKASVLASANETENGAVSEEAVSTEMAEGYAVAPEAPRIIKIPRLQVNARVKRIGINTAGTLESPANVHDVGWYEGSAKPGKKETTLISGHVHGTTNPGVFSRLSIIKEGDTVEIERGDGKLIEYKVVKTEAMEQEDIDLEKILAGGTPGESSLVLMTSSSRYDVRANKYEQRFFVYAVEQ